MPSPDFRPNFSLPDWGQTASKTRVGDAEKSENRRPSIDAKLVDTNDGKECDAPKTVDTRGRKESVATKLGWSTTFTMDEDKRASLVFEALRRENVAAEQVKQRKESMAIEASIEAQRKKSVTFASPNPNSVPKKPQGCELQKESLATPRFAMDDSFTSQARRSKSDGADSHHPSKEMSDQEQRSMSIAGVSAFSYYLSINFFSHLAVFLGQKHQLNQSMFQAQISVSGATLQPLVVARHMRKLYVATP